MTSTGLGVVRVEVSVALRAVAGSDQTAVVEIPRAEWDALGPDAREERLSELATEHVDNEVDAYARLMGDDE